MPRPRLRSVHSKKIYQKKYFHNLWENLSIFSLIPGICDGKVSMYISWFKLEEIQNRIGLRFEY